MVGRSNGIVMRLICCHAEAPSMADASYTSSEMSWIPAVYRMKFRPNVHHKVSSVTPNHAPPTLPRKFGAVSPTKLNALVIKPVSGVYMKAKMRQTADEGTT